ncbi:hypothetical protein IFM89_016331 [Coptis chinensis]|uniref:DNA ligase n=1 Tax=Coptis chinensis TaxID=261450 RepID=A0A835LJJ3_9MAGN|nr:hypothetical protein IFM89_016331 [Coptis chinensis]
MLISLRYSSLFLKSFSTKPKANLEIPKMSNPNPTRKNASDVLMAAARAAASQNKRPKPKPTTPPPKKLKQNPNPVPDNIETKISQLKPKLSAYWKQGESVPFLFLAKAFDMIANESSRITITEILCNVFTTVIHTTPKDLISVVYLSANKIAPAHQGIELGIGDASIIKALAEAYGREVVHIKSQLETLGDLGLVAKASRSSQRVMFKPAPLTVVKVLDTFRAIARFFFFLMYTLLVALGHAAVYSEKESAPSSQTQSSLEEAAKAVKQVYSVLPNYDLIIAALLDGGVCKLSETCSFTLGVPIGPMLAKPTKGVSEILDKFQDTEFTCEYKYDGERAQIHYLEDGSVEIYSRNAERNTGKFPDVVSSVERFKHSSVRSFVLDCEVVAYDREKQKILPFQVLSTRARKGVVMSDITVKVCIFAFDILYLNGQSLLQEQLKVRRELLYNSFQEVPGEFYFATAITSNDLEEIQKFLDAAVNSGCEGLIIKTLNGDATYEPSKRSLNWLKLKKDYMDGVGDSLDLVPIAAFHGRGKRTGVYGAFLLACYDDHNDEYQSICKIGKEYIRTGFSEAMLEERSASLRPKVIPQAKSYYRFAETVNPDVWFEPTEVWEVKAADLSISPVHRAATGVVDPNKGISLRFPRLLRLREDKTPEQATSSDQVAEMYRSQKIHQSNNQDEQED